MPNIEQILRAVIAAWDEPHYGDQDARSDTMFDAIEKARASLSVSEMLGVNDPLMTIDELCQAGLNSNEPKHWEAALRDIMDAVRVERSKGDNPCL